MFGDIIAIDETASMDGTVLANSIFPLVVMKDTTFCVLSTLKEGDNPMTRLIELKRPDGTFLFETHKFTMMCGMCMAESDFEKGIIKQCPHKMVYLARHHSKKQLEILDTLKKAGPQGAFAVETLNVVRGTQDRVFSELVVQQFRARAGWKVEGDIPYVYIGVDPDLGGEGPSSAFGLSAMTVCGGTHVILSQNTIATCSIEVQAVAICEMMKQIRRIRNFASCIFVICIEGNIPVFSQYFTSMIRNTYRHEWAGSVCMVNTKQSATASKAPGAAMKNEMKLNNDFILMMKEGRVAFANQFFTPNPNMSPGDMQSEFISQLESYIRVPLGNVDRSKRTGDIKYTATSKRSGRDDVLDAAVHSQIAYREFHLHEELYRNFYRGHKESMLSSF